MDVTRVRPLQRTEWRQGTWWFGMQVETWPAVYARHQPRGGKKDQPAANCSRVTRVLGLKLSTMSQQRRRSQLSKLITTLECESTDGTLRVAAFVNATDLEFEGSDAWRAGIDVDAWLTEGRDRAEIRDHRLTEQAAAYNPTAVTVRGYAAHCRTLAGSVTHAGYPSLAEAGWQQPRRELWKCWRSGDEDALADDEVRLLAQALADPLCPFFLCAFSMSCRSVHARTRSMLVVPTCYVATPPA